MNDMKKIWIVSLLLLGCFAARAQAPAPLKGRIAVSVPRVDMRLSYAEYDKAFSGDLRTAQTDLEGRYMLPDDDKIYAVTLHRRDDAAGAPALASFFILPGEQLEVLGLFQDGDTFDWRVKGSPVFEADYEYGRKYRREELRAGDVGYIISGLKTSADVKVGDTITAQRNPCSEAIAGFEDVKPMVFAGLYPVESDQYEDLRTSLEKLHLNDASLTYEPESSLALGFGFRCGFLGLLHMEIIQERLYREFDMDVITTVPNVSYKVHTTKGDVLDVHNPSGLPEPTLISSIEEPYILAQIITKTEYLGNVIKLCIDKRGTLLNQVYITQDRVEINFDMPLAEIVFDFYDKLKSISRGYASFDYHQTGYKPSKLAKLDILLNGEPVDALSSLTYVDHAYDFGRKMCEKLKELIPRQQFDIAIQAAIGAKIIARETVKAVRKDVTAKCYGGDISRKRKLLEKQKKGKKRMRQVGNVEVPQEAFLAVLKME